MIRVSSPGVSLGTSMNYARMTNFHQSPPVVSGGIFHARTETTNSQPIPIYVQSVVEMSILQGHLVRCFNIDK